MEVACSVAKVVALVGGVVSVTKPPTPSPYNLRRYHKLLKPFKARSVSAKRMSPNLLLHN